MINWTDEQNAVFNAKGNILVSASAGSGKTRVMVKKIIDILKSGVSIKDILVVSYTEASAADMRQQIVEGLYEIAKNKACLKEELNDICRQLDDLAFADIGTMDSFCGKIIRENFEFLNISPRLMQMEEKDSNEMKRRIINTLIDEKYEIGDKFFYETTFKLTNFFGDNKLADIVLSVFDASRINPDPDSFLRSIRESVTTNTESVYGKIVLDYYKDWATEILENAIEAKNFCELSLGKVHEKVLDASIEALHNFIGNTHLKEPLVLPYIINLKKEDISQDDANWISNIKKSVKSLYESFNKSLFVDLTGFDVKDAKKLVDIVLNLVDEFSKQYRAEKNDMAKIDFIDLSHLAIEVLNDKRRAKTIANKYQYIFVDEYQDINPLHEIILQKIATGNTFMVGDGKQGIYAFRNADNRIITDKRLSYLNKKENGTALSLSQNFRSTRSILAFVDKIFSAVMTIEHGGIDYKNDCLFLSPAVKTLPKEGVDVQIKFYYSNKNSEKIILNGVYDVLNEKNKDNAKVSDVYLEGIQVAHEIKKIINSHFISGEGKLFNYSDIAILFKKRTKSEDFIKALSDCGIPYVSEGFENEIGKAYIKQLKSLLKILDNSSDDIMLCGFMLSYFCGFDESELAKIRVMHPATSLWEGVKEDSQLDNTLAIKCRNLLSFISHWRKRAAYLRVGELLNEIIAETGFDAYILSSPQGRDELAAVKCYIDSILSLEVGDTIQNYLSYLENAVQDKTSVPASDFGNSVKLVTVHGSKGLQYPVVFLVTSNDCFNDRNKPDFIFDKNLGMGLTLYNETERTKIKALSYNALDLAKKRRESEELIRLLYVALTRAQEMLYVTGTIKDEQTAVNLLNMPNPIICAKSFMDLIFNAASKNRDLAKMITVNEYNVPSEIETPIKVTIFNKPNDLYLEEISKVVNFDYPYKSSTTIANKYSVSQINRSIDDAVYIPTIISDDDNRRKGIVYHTVMENIDFSYSTLSEVNIFIESLIKRGLINSDDAILIDVNQIFTCINSKIIKKGMNGKYLRERSFILRAKASDILDSDSEDFVLVQGTVDLCFLGENNYLIDFKYSTLSDEKLAQKYKKQLYLYKKAIESAFNVKNLKVLLYSFASGRFIEIK